MSDVAPSHPSPRGALIAIGASWPCRSSPRRRRLTGAAETAMPSAPVVSPATCCSRTGRTAPSPCSMRRIRPRRSRSSRPETNGFLRGTMRGLARQRVRQDADRDIPFRLTEWADGRLTLEDPTTGRMVEMEAFGSTNEDAFAAAADSEGAGSMNAPCGTRSKSPASIEIEQTRGKSARPRHAGGGRHRPRRHACWCMARRPHIGLRRPRRSGGPPPSSAPGCSGRFWARLTGLSRTR